jgi:Na+-driven multidrug efflux pump
MSETSERSESGKQRKINFCQIFRSVSGLSGLAVLSYAFSYEVFAVGVLAGLVNGTNASLAVDPNNTAEVYQAADTLMMPLMNSVAIVPASALFSIAALISKDLGAIDNLIKQRGGVNQATDIAERIDKLKRRIASSNRDALALTAFLLSPMAFFTLYFSANLLKGLGQDEAVADVAQSFLRPMAPAMVALLLHVVFEQIAYGFKKLWTAVGVGLVSLVLVVAFATMLGLGYGLPNLGLPGIAYACLGGLLLSATAYAVNLVVDKDLKEYQFFNFSRLSCKEWGFLGDITRQAGPLVLSYANEVSVSICLSIFSGLIGKAAQSQLSTIMQFFYFILTLSTAFGQICWQELSRLIGKTDYQHAHALARWGLATAAIWIGAVCAAAALIYTAWVKSDSWQDDLVFPIFALAIWVDSLRYNVLQQQRALSDNLCSTIISASGLWGGIGVSALLGLQAQWGNVGLGCGYLLGSSAAFAGLLVRWLRFSQADTMQQREESKVDSVACSCSGLFRRGRARSRVYPAISDDSLKRSLLA